MFYPFYHKSDLFYSFICKFSLTGPLDGINQIKWCCRLTDEVSNIIFFADIDGKNSQENRYLGHWPKKYDYLVQAVTTRSGY